MSTARAHACKVCDRKFYVRELVKKSRQVIEEQSHEIANLRAQVQKHQLQCDSLDYDFKQYKERIDQELDKQR